MSEHPLDPLLRPRSIALLGASDRAGSPGAVLADMVINSDYAGDVYPVNPRCDRILGQTCYPDLDALPATVEHVVIALGNARLEAALQAAIEHGAGAATIYSSGVLESDTEPCLTARLRALAGAAGLPICGLNGMGFYNPGHGLYAGIFPRATGLQKGVISYIAQSGSAFTTLCHNGCRLGFSLCVSAGNEITTTVADYMDWSLAQADTRVIGLFLETVRDADAFVAALARARRQQVPVVALKVGKSARAAAMALTHTGAIAGDHAVFEALFRRYGVIEVDDFDEMASILMLLQSGRAAGAGGFAAIFESGGLRELIADEAERQGLEFAELEAATVDALRQHLEPGLEPENPLDAWGSQERFEERFEACLELLMRDPNVAGGAFISNYRDGYFLSQAIYRVVEAVSRSTGKPLALATCYSDLANQDLCRRAFAAGIPLLDGARTTLLAFRHLFAYHRFLRQQKFAAETGLLDPQRLDFWRARLRVRDAALGEAAGLELLADFGIPVVPHRLVATRDELTAAAAATGYPLVLKTAESGLEHKSDSSGVIVDIHSRAELERHYDDLSRRLGPAVLLAQMLGDGVEIGLGTVNDPQFGPVVMVAAGGVMIELLSDRALALCPVDARAADALLRELRVEALLRGARGRPAVQRQALIDSIVKLSQIAFELRDCIDSIDVNPVIAAADGAHAADALIIPRAG